VSFQILLNIVEEPRKDMKYSMLDPCSSHAEKLMSFKLSSQHNSNNKVVVKKP
jgi:hypothetical protein